MSSFMRAAEARVVQNENGWWNLQIRPIGSDSCWSTTISSTEKSGLELVAAWWQNRLVEWSNDSDD